jgi:leader peptidase (prepilin peptidase)/N-methyltransferase
MILYGLTALAATVLMCCAVSIACGVAAKHGLRLRFAILFSVCTLVAGALLQIFVSMAGKQFALPTCIGVACVTVSAITDTQSGYVFDAVTLPALGAMLAVSALHQDFSGAFFGACAAAALVGAMYAATFGRGIGLGDVKLSACIGAALGAADALASLGTAFVLGGVYASFMLATGRAHRGDSVRFGPYIAAGMALVILHRTIA